MTETNEQQIERLRNNERGWVFLSDNDKECIKTANEKGKIENLTYTGDWENNITGYTLSDVGANEIFRICPDYQPEPAKPEYIDRPVSIEPNGLVVVCPEGEHKFIDSIVHRSDFRGFNEVSEVGEQSYIPLDCIASRVAKGVKIIARFEKRR